MVVAVRYHLVRLLGEPEHLVRENKLLGELVGPQDLRRKILHGIVNDLIEAVFFLLLFFLLLGIVSVKP